MPQTCLHNVLIFQLAGLNQAWTGAADSIASAQLPIGIPPKCIACAICCACHRVGHASSDLSAVQALQRLNDRWLISVGSSWSTLAMRVPAPAQQVTLAAHRSSVPRSTGYVPAQKRTSPLLHLTCEEAACHVLISTMSY